MYSVFTFYVISFITAAAIVVPCLSTLVSDHGEPLLYSYLLKKTHKSNFDFIHDVATVADYLLWMFLQAQPIRRAQ